LQVLDRPASFWPTSGSSAGIWTRWTSVRKVKEGETTNDIFAFLTTEPNALVHAYHPKAMPVILTTQEEIDIWMMAPALEALRLQRPLADDALIVVAKGEKQDPPATPETRAVAILLGHRRRSLPYGRWRLRNE
jgi:putative SOS response-associated peptidase YedK